MSLTSTSGLKFSSASSASPTEPTAFASAPLCFSIVTIHSRVSTSSSTTSTCKPSREGAVSLCLGAREISPPADSYPSPSSAFSTRGIFTVNVEPCPTPWLCAEIVPPCISTICWAIASPKPRPFCDLVLLLSAWRKRSKTYGRKSALIPLPVSMTWIQAKSPG